MCISTYGLTDTTLTLPPAPAHAAIHGIASMFSHDDAHLGLVTHAELFLPSRRAWAGPESVPILFDLIVLDL
jgi:hypothetical protein